MSSVLTGFESRDMRHAGVLRLMILGVLIALLLAAYGETWLSMVAVWDTPSYAHGYVVPLIAAWLAWRDRDRLAATPLDTGWSALPLLAATGLLWLAGELAGVNAARHFAVVGMAVLLVPHCLGWRAARALAFPLGFLFFAVPFGEFLLPIMMEWTATVTIALVQMTGVPIHREGLSFVLPSGAWEIIEECSGQRYLVAALPLACLFAWLRFTRNRTRIAFVVFAAGVALVANWLRAWGIVMLGHASDMKLATGVDHLVYGWGFFGLVMLLIFWLGSRWNEGGSVTEVVAPAQRSGEGSWPTAEAGGPRIRLRLPRMLAVVPAGAALVAAWPWAAMQLVAVQPAALDLAALTANISDLRPGITAGKAAADDRSFRPGYRGAAQEIVLEAKAEPAFAWLGVYERQEPGREMVGHANTLSARPAREWQLIAERPASGHAPGGPEVAREFLLEQGGARWLVWRSHLVDGRYIADPRIAKLRGAWRLIRGGGDRAIAVILWTPLADDGSPAQARAASRLSRTFAALAQPLAAADSPR